MKTFRSLEEMQEAFLDLKRERGRPWVYASGAMTLNGKIRGTRSPFGGPLDRAWYQFLLSEAETIVLGARTFREAGVGRETDYQDKRIVVFSDSLDLPIEAPAVANRHPFVIYTNNRDPEKRKALLDLGKNVEIRDLGHALGPKEIIRDLGSERILVDGGGYIYTFFTPVIQDWFLTLIPRFTEKTRPSLWIEEKEESPELEPQWILAREGRILMRLKRED